MVELNDFERIDELAIGIIECCSSPYCRKAARDIQSIAIRLNIGG